MKREYNLTEEKLDKLIDSVNPDGTFSIIKVLEILFEVSIPTYFYDTETDIPHEKIADTVWFRSVLSSFMENIKKYTKDLKEMEKVSNKDDWDTDRLISENLVEPKIIELLKDLVRNIEKIKDENSMTWFSDKPFFISPESLFNLEN
jgi:hypothetical protein